MISNYPDFDEATVKLRHQLICRSYPEDTIWVFAEDIAAYAGHWFLKWPPPDNGRLVRERYDSLMAEAGIATLGCLCMVDGRSVCYLSASVRAGGRTNLRAGLHLSFRLRGYLRGRAVHKVPRLLWPLATRLLSLSQTDSGLRRLALARRREQTA